MTIEEDFRAYISERGVIPARAVEIIADDQRHYIQLEGDRGGTKKGAYCLKIEADGFAVGWAVNYRCGEYITYTKRTATKLTPEEKKAIDSRIKEEKARKDAERKAATEAAAIRADRLWRKTIVGASPYLQRKGITGSHGTRQLRGLTVAPAYRNKKIVTLQFITEDGQKRFLTDGEKHGSYLPLATADEDKSVIVFAEGVATGCTLREALEVPVLICWDANNLLIVAEEKRKEFPNAQFVFAADNDAFTVAAKFKPRGIDTRTLDGNSPYWAAWREQGHLYNTGLDKARQAAVKIGGARVIWPEFADVTSKPTDFNDLHQLEGIEAVRQRFAAPEVEVAPEPEPAQEEVTVTEYDDNLPEYPEDAAEYWAEQAEFMVDEIENCKIKAATLYEKSGKAAAVDHNWRVLLEYTDKGKPKNTKRNLNFVLRHHPDICDIFCYDEFFQQPMICACPPWIDEAKFIPRMMEGTDVTNLQIWAQSFDIGIDLGKGDIDDCLNAVIRDNKRNPVRLYFRGLEWDGVPRLNTWLRDYCGAIDDPEEYTSFVGRKWLCAAVARVFSPGKKFDHILVFEGKQGTGKSTVLKELGTFGSDCCFTDDISLRSLENKETVSKIQGVLIVEFPELSGLGRATTEELKAFITRTHDRPVQKYEKYTSIFPRQCVFAGTINPEDGYLTDTTGNRRFWPVSTGRIDLAGLKAVKDQLWAEASHHVRNGEEIFVTDKMCGLMREAVEKRRQESPWHDSVNKITRDCCEITTDEVFDKLNIIDMTKRTRPAKKEISSILHSLGFVYKNKRYGQRVVKMWIREHEELPID